jgi:hypothetical protein
MQQNGRGARLPGMPTRRTKLANRGSNKGSFADSHNGLLPLFGNADGSRRWPEVFGLERRKDEKQAGPFNALEERRSSSGSK